MTQLAMQIFDVHVGMTRCNEGPIREDFIIIVHLLACFYLCLKSEHRINSMGFVTFVQYCVSLPSFQALAKFLEPNTVNPLECFGSASDAKMTYLLMEQTILEDSLRWKTNLVTVAGFIHELFCTHRIIS